MRRWPLALMLSALIVTGAGARDTVPAGARDTAPARDTRWIATWGSSQMIVEGDNALPADRAGAITLRQVVRVSAGGERVRIRLSNAFGTRPLAIGGAHLARSVAPGTPRIEGGARLTFSGQNDAVIPAGAEIYSDPIALRVAAGADLAVSLYLPDAASPQTGHPGSRATSFTLAGNAVADATLAGATPTIHWYALADVEVTGAPIAATIAAIGDSITDGYGVKPERNTRWPDVLAQRLRARPATQAIGVVNAGIGGNRVLLDGLGPNLLARFDRDVVARSGVRWAIVLEGVNDLGVLTRDAPATPAQHAALVAQLKAGFMQLVARGHAHGITVIGGTIMPFGGNTYYHPDAANEADRQAINTFIRTSGIFDAVIDFDQVMRDPSHLDRLLPAFDSGDHLHPSETGYRVMGEAVPLALFGAAAGFAIGASAPAISSVRARSGHH
ncbi:SGNH/GDSL hydrolase family protein [Sphingomonas sp. 4RDLI-65]